MLKKVSAKAKPSVEGMNPLPYSTIQVPALHWTDVASPTACTIVSPVGKEYERTGKKNYYYPIILQEFS